MKTSASAVGQPEQTEHRKMSRLFAWIMICVGIGSGIASYFDHADSLLSSWDFYMTPIISVCCLVSGVMIYFRPQWLTAAILLSAIPSGIYQQGVMFMAVHYPSAASYYAAAASGAFFPLLYIALFIILPAGAARLSWIHCAGFYLQFLLNATVFSESSPSAERIGADHIMVQVLMAHPVYIIALSYIVRLRERLHATQQEAHQHKEQFLAMLSHEIRNLLQTMVGAIDLLSIKLKEPAERRSVERLQKAATQLQTYLSDINELTKLEDPAVKINASQFDLKLLLDDIHDEWLPEAEQRGLQLEVQMRKTENGRALLIHTDEARLRQIISNLVSNALKYTEVGCVTIAASSSASSPDCALIEVIDTGIGIEEKYLERIFQPYVRLDNAIKRSEEGSGLGLSIVQRLVASIGGSLRVESQLDKGSRFVVTVPGLAG